MWRIIFVECQPVGGQGGSIGTLMQFLRNAQRELFSNTWEKMRRGKHCKSQETAASGYLRVHRYPSWQIISMGEEEQVASRTRLKYEIMFP